MPFGPRSRSSQIRLVAAAGFALVLACAHPSRGPVSAGTRPREASAVPAKPPCDATPWLAGPHLSGRAAGGRVHVQHGGVLPGPSHLGGDGAYLATWTPVGVQVHDLASGREIFATPPVEPDRWGWTGDRLFVLDTDPRTSESVASTWSVLQGDVAPIHVPLATRGVDGGRLGPLSVVVPAGLVVAPLLADPQDAANRCPGAALATGLAWYRLRDARTGRLSWPTAACTTAIAAEWSRDGAWSVRREVWRSDLVADDRVLGSLPEGAIVLATGRAVLIVATGGEVSAIPVTADGLGPARVLVTRSITAASIGPDDRSAALVAGDTLQLVPLADGGPAFTRTLPPRARLVAPLPGGCAALVIDGDGRLGALAARTADDRWAGEPRRDFVVDWRPDRGSLEILGGPPIALEQPPPPLPAPGARKGAWTPSATGVDLVVDAVVVRHLDWPKSPARGEHNSRGTFARDRPTFDTPPDSGEHRRHAFAVDPGGRFVAMMTFSGHDSGIVVRPAAPPRPAVLAVHPDDGPGGWSRELSEEPTALALAGDAVLVASGRRRSRLTAYARLDGRPEPRRAPANVPGGPLVALAASADGTRFAGVSDHPSHLVIWDASGRILLVHDLADARRPRGSHSPYRFRDLENALLSLSADGTAVAWTDPVARRRPESNVVDTMANRARADGLDTSLWRVEDGTLVLAGRHAWVHMTADAIVTGEPGGRVIAHDLRSLAPRWQIQVYASGAWVRWSGAEVERSPRAAAVLTEISAGGVTDPWAPGH